ncbi:MAG: hypothetical protein U0802_10955 [Candidatus Binatia bacterium]
MSSAVTAHCCAACSSLEDFTEATFLLSVLGEGTFLDLLRYVEAHAPDPVTAEVARRGAPTRRGTSTSASPTCARRRPRSHLRGATRGGGARRAAGLDGSGGVPARRRADRPRGRLDRPGRGRRARRLPRPARRHARRPRTRLEHAGFTPEQAETLSALHTPNFM